MTVIEVSNLRKGYRDKLAVQDVSLSVEQGEIFGILGPNGAGKTTTVECIAGLRARDGGTISVLGSDPQRDRADIKLAVGVQLQTSQMPEKLTVAESLQLFSSFYPEPADWEKLMNDLGLSEKRNTAYAKLSGGQQQRLSIALALVGNPKIAILDELTTGLDPNARRETWDLIEYVRDRGVTIVLVTHFMEEAERLCDRLAIIDSGVVIAQNTPAGLVDSLEMPQRVRFRAPKAFDESILTVLPEVTEVSSTSSQVVVTGTGNLLQVVSAALTRHEIVASDLRVEQTNLEDAFVALTNRKPAETA